MTTKIGLTTTKDGVADLLKAIKGLTKKEVLIGVPMESSERQPEEGESVAPTNAEIGYWMEYGVPEQNIPARPFLQPGVRNALDDVTKIMAAGMKKTLAGDKEAADTTLNRVGLIGQGAVQQKITNGPFKELSEVTLERRRYKGRTGEKPLLDTGALRQSITYAVRPKGE
ncbi:hypothetical protein [Allorhizobium ampelinum]|uniref:hypothetical protein n=1 Tax=Allorhizobium ampelinum TaxID=3025782 RepID=UPI000B3F9E0C|nr:hypothetical protein [Allorhizobium ampelinum]NTA27400.1 hypothetical protein [Allorhizobium ampelinum]OVE94456.1 hypothetical protein B7W85_12965 [Allorhizobium ampelinum]